MTEQEKLEIYNKIEVYIDEMLTDLTNDDTESIDKTIKKIIELFSK